jgi:hypothetical protein
MFFWKLSEEVKRDILSTEITTMYETSKPTKMRTRSANKGKVTLALYKDSNKIPNQSAVFIISSDVLAQAGLKAGDFVQLRVGYGDSKNLGRIVKSNNRIGYQLSNASYERNDKSLVKFAKLPDCVSQERHERVPVEYVVGHEEIAVELPDWFYVESLAYPKYAELEADRQLVSRRGVAPITMKSWGEMLSEPSAIDRVANALEALVGLLTPKENQ